jgi:hypothetical protein
MSDRIQKAAIRLIDTMPASLVGLLGQTTAAQGARWRSGTRENAVREMRGQDRIQSRTNMAEPKARTETLR